MMRHLVSVFASQVAIFVLSLVTSVLSCRLLGPEQRGVLVVTLLFTTLVGAVTYFGLPHSLTYNISRAKDAKRALNQAISVSLRVLPCSLLVAALLYFAAYALGRDSLVKGLTPALLVSSYCFYVVVFLQLLVRQIFVGLQDFRWRNVVRVVPAVVTASVVLLAWMKEWEVTPLVLVCVHIIANSLALVIGTQHLLRRYRPRISLRVPADWLATHVWFGVKFYVALVAQTLNYRLDNLILNLLLGNLAVGLYATGVSVAELLVFFPTTVNFVYYPKIASIPVDQRHRLTALTIGTSLYVVIGASGVLVMLSPWIIPFFFGSEFSPAVPASQWLVPGMVALTVVKLLCHAFAGSGRPEYATYTTCVGLIGTVVLDFLLIPEFGIVGAAWASSIAYSLAAGTALILYLRLTRLRAEQLARDLVVVPIVWLQAKYRQFSAG